MFTTHLLSLMDFEYVNEELELIALLQLGIVYRDAPAQ